jgi:glycosyltransferase involved in cell wall biosynthesis
MKSTRVRHSKEFYKRMKILYIAPDIPVPHTGEFLGGTTHTLKVAESLVKKGGTIFIISRRVSGQPKFEKLSEKIYTRRFYRSLLLPAKGKIKSMRDADKTISLKLLENIYFYFYRIILAIYVLWILSRHHFDLLVERNSAKGIGVFPAKLFGIKTVVEVIDPDYCKMQLGFADRILAYTREIIPIRLQKKVVLTYAGVDTGLFVDTGGKEIRDKYRLGKKVVVYVGELSEWHGVEMLIDLAEKLKDVKFLMVGKNLETLREETKKRDFSERFAFTGFVRYEEVPKYICAADVAIAPYKKIDKMETFYFSPIKIFEYMACGKAVVASDLEIIRDVIKDTKCGLLAKAGDVEDFAEKIKRLLDDDILRKRLGENGRKAVEKYSWDKVAEKILG